MHTFCIMRPHRTVVQRLIGTVIILMPCPVIPMDLHKYANCELIVSLNFMSADHCHLCSCIHTKPRNGWLHQIDLLNEYGNCFGTGTIYKSVQYRLVGIFYIVLDNLQPIATHIQCAVLFCYTFLFDFVVFVSH